MFYSIIIPVYNRPDEIGELLESITEGEYHEFEVIIVEDGSTLPCKDVVDKYLDRLNIRYFWKTNSGPAQSRNYGAERSKGDWLVFFDSDCIIPDAYFEQLEYELEKMYADAFGGPDKAHYSFTPIQKAINYAMTSFFTTGGIRGGKKKMDKFYPRSFNMGIRKEAFDTLGGFSDMRFGEDIDFSIRIFKAGYSCRLFPEAWVYHKRRTDFRKFFKQVYNSGIARINLSKMYPGTLKLVHLLPTLFTLGVIFLLISSFICPYALLPIFLYALIIAADSGIRNRSISIGLLSVAASFVQLTGYGLGFLTAWWKRCVLGRGKFTAFDDNFYK